MDLVDPTGDLVFWGAKFPLRRIRIVAYCKPIQQRAPYPGDTMMLSHFTVVSLGTAPRGRLLFPGHTHWSEQNLGYVRSLTRWRAAGKEKERWDLPELPWRDYSKDMLTNAEHLLTQEEVKDKAFLTVGFRNILNEFGYRIRYNSTWYSRYLDPAPDPEWPVLKVCNNGAIVLEKLLHASNSDADLGLGVPLVIDGQPQQRSFFVAHCSDIAHSYHVHPKGLIEPTSPQAWRELSEQWQQLRQAGMPDEEFFRSMELIAQKWEAKPNNHVLHSVFAQTKAGEYIIFAVTGGLDIIARMLVNTWNVQHALILDNGGSVGWRLHDNRNYKGQLLLSGPNHRPSGTVFLSVHLSNFLQLLQHRLIGPNWDAV